MKAWPNLIIVAHVALIKHIKHIDGALIAPELAVTDRPPSWRLLSLSDHFLACFSFFCWTAIGSSDAGHIGSKVCGSFHLLSCIGGEIVLASRGVARLLAGGRHRSLF
jgi:hypothetical protein